MKNQGSKEVSKVTNGDASSAFRKQFTLDYIQNGIVDPKEDESCSSLFAALKAKGNEANADESKKHRTRYVSTGLLQDVFSPGSVFLLLTIELFVDTEAQTLCIMDNSGRILARQVKDFPYCHFAVLVTSGRDPICQFFSFFSKSVPYGHVLVRAGKLLLERFFGHVSYPPSQEYICQGCGLVGTNEVSLLRCSKCKFTVYCSKRCQLASAPVHHEICNMAATYAEIRKTNNKIREGALVDSAQMRELILQTYRLPEFKLGATDANARNTVATSNFGKYGERAMMTGSRQAFSQQQQSLPSLFKQANASEARFEDTAEWANMSDQMRQIATEPSLAETESFESVDERLQTALNNIGEYDLEHEVEDTGLNDKYDLRENWQAIRDLISGPQGFDSKLNDLDEARVLEEASKNHFPESHPGEEEELSLYDKDQVE